MKTKLLTICLLLPITLSGCYGPNKDGNSLNTSYSLDDLRKANKSVKYSETLPENVEVIGSFFTERCHRYLTDEKPTKQTLMNDLVLLAYSQGADGFSEFKLEETSGILKSCWIIYKATGTFYKIK